jgi:serine/threonine protein kinase/dipeptidyl aminopeptidase/acylaminoacyl peptidase
VVAWIERFEVSGLQPEWAISHYRVKELIGRGGMGEVYKAVDVQLGRVVALKTLSPALSSDPSAHQRFLREARAASILSHPSICTVFEVGQDGDLTFISMQYIVGRTLAQLLSGGPLPIESALAYALDITDALSEAHRHKVVHRDIKPSNIMINERGVAVVLDFGLAKQVGPLEISGDDTPTLIELTAALIVVGTAPYMSPEQLRCGQLDHRSDIFSVGVTLYEMLTGARPFVAATQIDLMHAVLHNEPTPIHHVRPELDAELNGIVAKAIKKQAEDRFQSADELRNALIAYIHKKGYVVRGVSTASNRADLLESAATRVFDSTVSAEAVRTAPPRSVTARKGLLVLGALLIIAAASWFALKSLSGSDADVIPSLRHVEVSKWKSEAGEGYTAGTFSPDGKMIAFASTRAGRMSIWIKQTGRGDAVQITKDDASSQSPVWSPDGSEIAFIFRRGAQAGIGRIPAFGGVPESLGALESGATRLVHWSKDGSRIYYESRSNLHALDVASGRVTQLTELDAASSAQHFSASPDEARIVYSAIKDGQVDLWLGPINGGAPERLTDDPARDRNPVWHPDGKRISYSSERDGAFQACVAYVDRRAPLQLTHGEKDILISDVSGDGTRILYWSSNEESDIWRVNLDTGEESEVTSDVGCELWPDVSPDGRSLAFQRIQEPGQGSRLQKCVLVARLLAEGQTIQLAVNGHEASWSPDGLRVAFLRNSGSADEIWTVGLRGGDERKLTTHPVFTAGFSVLPYSRAVVRNFSWSPDGRSLAYCSRGVWLVSSEGGGETSLVESADPNVDYYAPTWSNDGRRVAYVSFDYSPDSRHAWRVWTSDVANRESKIAFQVTSNQTSSLLGIVGWWGESELLVKLREGPHINLSRVPVGGGAPRTIARLTEAYFNNIHLSPDRRIIAFSSHQDGKDNLWIIPAVGGDQRKITGNTDPRLYFSTMAFSPNGRTIFFGKQSRSSLISVIDKLR